jgi:hypothetical protein
MSIIQRIKWPSEWRELSVALRSLDHFVRAQQQRLRDGESECLGSLEIDDQLELPGLLNGEIGCLSTSQDLVYVVGSPPERPAAALVGQRSRRSRISLTGQNRAFESPRVRSADNHVADLNHRRLIGIVRNVRHDLLRVRAEASLKRFDRVAMDMAHADVGGR